MLASLGRSSLHISTLSRLLHCRFFFLIIYLSDCFWLCSSSLPWGLLSGLGKRGLLSGCRVRASRGSGFSCCRAQALGARASVVVVPGLWSTGSVVVVHRFSLPLGIWNLPRSGIKSMSPALAGRVFTTEPPEKSHPDCFLLKDCMD